MSFIFFAWLMASVIKAFPAPDPRCLGEIYIEPITAMCLSLNSECLEILRIPISLSCSKAPSKMALPASSLALNFSDGLIADGDCVRVIF